MKNLEFAAGTELWGTSKDHLELAAGLASFLERPSAPATFQLGAPGVGYLRLEFFSLDTLGHIGVWSTVESKYPAARSEGRELASLFMQCDPASIDRFTAALRRFSVGSANRAELSGVGP
ncbi:hypothetical protein ACFFGH_34270 [Lysobacter korlensis]|uniref:Uncharacterized protein n=1 Tax=Lysobacter korlensis TaxID=553636 RepID=A0ABV6S118_9GAMM